MEIFGVMTVDLIDQTATRFWFEKVVPLAQKEGLDTITVICKFQDIHGTWRSLGHFSTWNVSDHFGYINFLTSLLLSVANHYVAAGWIVKQIDFQYKLLKPEDSVLRLRTQTLQQQTVLESKNFNQIANAIPLTNDLKAIEGAIVAKGRFENQWYIKNIWLKNVLGVDTVQTIWSVEPIHTNTGTVINNVSVAIESGAIIAKFTDEIYINEQGQSMVNITFADGSRFIFENQLIKEQTAKEDFNNVFMQNASEWSWEGVKLTKFLTYDIETRENLVFDENGKVVLDNSGEPIKKLSIISISMFHKELDQLNTDNKSSQYWTWFINDFENEQQLINKFFNTVREFAVKYGGNIQLMAHNSAQFDMIFLMKYLIEMNEDNKDALNFLIRDKKFIAIDWNVESGRYFNKKDGTVEKKYLKIKFMDSFLMLPMSLAKAAKQFNVEDKGSFDFELINQNIDKEFLNKVQSKALLEKYRKEILNYNLQDCRVLWFVMANFAQTTVNKFKVNIFKQPTAASIAFATFKTMFLKPEQHKIPLTSKHIYDMISQAYMGGACDVYKPFNPEGTNVYTYDINSEYPAMMATKLMPTGVYKHVIGPIDISNPELIAFVKAKITAPEDIKVPLLPMNVGGKMVTGVGTFEGMYYSKELNYALSLGYQIEAYEAYIFEGRLVFDEFITNLYKERLSYPKSNPMNYICKLIMNSTYGRFGMAPILTDVKIFNPNDIHNYQENTKFLDITNINDNLVMVTSQEPANIELLKNANRNLQISIPIAAAITSYARICIHEYKQAAAEAGILLYSDTDSLMTSAPLADELLGTELGKLKLEYTAEQGIFLSAKVYALKNVAINGMPVDDIIKAKGMKKAVNLKFEHFEKLLDKKEVYRAYQQKWFRSISEGQITIKQLSSMVRINEGKRIVVTDLKDQFIDTWNVIFEDGQVVSPNVIKIGLPVCYNGEGHLDQIAFNKATELYIEEGAKDPKYIIKAQEKAAKAAAKALRDEAAAAERARMININLYHKAIKDRDLSILQDKDLMSIITGKPFVDPELRGLDFEVFQMYALKELALRKEKYMETILKDQDNWLRSNFPFLYLELNTIPLITAPNKLLISAPLEEERDIINLPSKLIPIIPGETVIELPAPQRKGWLPKSEWIAQQKALGLFKEYNKPYKSVDLRSLTDKEIEKMMDSQIFKERIAGCREYMRRVNNRKDE